MESPKSCNSQELRRLERDHTNSPAHEPQAHCHSYTATKELATRHQPYKNMVDRNACRRYSLSRTWTLYTDAGPRITGHRSRRRGNHRGTSRQRISLSCNDTGYQSALYCFGRSLSESKVLLRQGVIPKVEQTSVHSDECP